MNDQERREAISEQEVEQLERLAGGPLGAMAFPLLAEAHRRSGRPEEAERVAREGLRHAAPATAGRIALTLALLDQKRGEEARAELEGILGGEAEHAIAQQAAASLARESESRGGPERYAGDAAARDDEASLETHVPVEPPVQGPFGPPPVSFEASTNPEASPASARPFAPPPPPAPVEALVFGGDVGDGELDEAFAEAESEREQMLGADDVARAALAQVPDDDELADTGSGAVMDPVADPSSPFATETVATLLERQGHGDQAERVRAGLDPERPAPTPRPSSGAPVAPAADGDFEPEPLDVRPDPMPIEAPGDPGFSSKTDLMPLGPDGLAEPIQLARPAASEDAGVGMPAPSRAAADPLADLPPSETVSGVTGNEPPKQTQATLERWLDNLRRDRR